jgi:hypothetical protein
MSKADTLNARADEAERRAVAFPAFREQYLQVAATWRAMARQALLLALH